jgi:hypothetical protein
MVIGAAVAAGALGAAGAQSFELTPFAGIRLGGEFEDGTTAETRALDESPSFGIIAGFPLGQDRTLEIVWSHQEGRVGAGSDGGGAVELDLDAVTLGGTYEWVRERTRPFVSGTGGLTVLSPEAAGYDRDVLLAFTLGGGVKVPISRHVAVRLEGRGVLTLAVGGAAGVCGGGACALSFSGAGIGQLELLAGVTWSR